MLEIKALLVLLNPAATVHPLVARLGLMSKHKELPLVHSMILISRWGNLATQDTFNDGIKMSNYKV
jgi:hypothetical protein